VTNAMPTYTRSPDLIATEMDGDIVMMSLEKGSYFGLDGVGGAIWELMASPVTLDEIVGNLVARFEIEEEVCRADAQAFVEDLVDNGLAEAG